MVELSPLEGLVLATVHDCKSTVKINMLGLN
jgi:hypothetical protein